MGIGDWGLGIGDWGLGPIPNPQSPYETSNIKLIFKKINLKKFNKKKENIINCNQKFRKIKIKDIFIVLKESFIYLS